MYTYIRIYICTFVYAHFFFSQGSGKRVAALTDVLDLAGIAACDAHIMSTSSFSWCVEVCCSVLQRVAVDLAGIASCDAHIVLYMIVGWLC